ncbi:MAG: cysteine hydrolase [Proteobacteria bacterium]|nr:cysteine hydrolase [Pseudomonadota bacterium]
MSWKTAYRSMYYEGAPEPEDLDLAWSETALLVIDVQNTYLETRAREDVPPDEQAKWDRWVPFNKRMREIVIPNTRAMIDTFRGNGLEVMFARIACLTQDGRDRSLSQKKPGWNYLLMPRGTEESRLVPELEPQGDEIVITKTTDSALTGTNLRLILRNMEIENVVACGIFTDQCISSTVRSLADESYDVVVLEDCCAAGTDELHHKELEIINNIYCHVMSSRELRDMMKLGE